MQTETTKKLFTVDEYYRMADAGILAPNDRTELINGEIIVMASMGSRHAAIVSRVNNFLVPLFKDKALLRPQLPLRLNDWNEPEPDIVLLKLKKDCYADKHPGAADVYVVMEISDSSLKYDRDVKLPIYATARVPEVWIADLNTETLFVYRDPSRDNYLTSLSLTHGNTAACMAFPDVKVPVDEILG